MVTEEQFLTLEFIISLQEGFVRVNADNEERVRFVIHFKEDSMYEISYETLDCFRLEKGLVVKRSDPFPNNYQLLLTNLAAIGYPPAIKLLREAKINGIVSSIGLAS